MIPILVDGPAVEPITLAEMKAYLRVDDDDPAQDSVIAGLVKAARLTVEGPPAASSSSSAGAWRWTAGRREGWCCCRSRR